MPNTTNALTKSEAVNKAADAVDTISSKAINAASQARDAAVEAARQAKNGLNKAQYQLGKVASKGEKLAKENPWAAAATMFGVGALVGAVAVKLFTPKPTVSSVLGVDRIPDYARGQYHRQLKALKKLF